MRPMSILVSVLAISAAVTVRAQDPRTTVVRDAQRLAYCMVALNATCVTALSGVAVYERLSKPAFDFAKSQRSWFDGLKRVGASYTQMDVSTHPQVFTLHGRLYAFVPYRQTMHWPGHPIRSHSSYLIGVSRDSGLSWKFVGGPAVTDQNVQLVIKGYRGSPPRPPSEHYGLQMKGH